MELELEIVTLKEKEKWKEIILSFKDADVYYSREYVQGFFLHGDGEPLLFYFIEENGDRAVNVVMKRDISLDKNFEGKLQQGHYFDLVTPYGYGGLVYECSGRKNEFLNQLNEVYMKYCLQNNIICEFVRFHPNINNGPGSTEIYDVLQLGQTICMDLVNKETIWDNIISKNKNVIRKAQKSGVEVKKGMTWELMEKFIQLYNQTMDRDHAGAYYYFGEEFYKSILKDLKDNAVIFYAEWQNTIIATSIVLHSGDRMHYHLSASNVEFRSLAPTNLLLFEAACWGSDRGYKTFHLGGGLGSKADNLYKFKKAFNKQENVGFWIGKKIFNESLYDELLEIRRQDRGYNENSGFFPKYRG